MVPSVTSSLSLRPHPSGNVRTAAVLAAVLAARLAARLAAGLAARLAAGLSFILVPASCREAVPPLRSAQAPAIAPQPHQVSPPLLSTSLSRLTLQPAPKAEGDVHRKPEGIIEARPSCETYCELLIQYCSRDARAFKTLDRCMADCQHASLGPGRSASMQQDTLGCRVAWAQAAAQDNRHCDDAGISSPACGADGVLPVVTLPRFEGGTCVLGLWDSTDAPTWKGSERARDVILGQWVREAVEVHGLTLSLHDVDGGLPPEPALRTCQAVVTSFYDAEMKDAARYAAWLRAVIQSGRRVIILNDYGAFFDKSTNAWLDHPVLNAPFMALGVEYGAEWTGNGKMLTVSGYDEKFFVARPDPKVAQHYFRFRSVSGDLTVHLELSRKDVVDSASAVVFSGPRGGMALSRYFETQDGVPLVDLSAFLGRILGRYSRALRN